MKSHGMMLFAGCVAMGVGAVAMAGVDEVWSVLYDGPQGLDDVFVDAIADASGVLIVGDATVYSTPRDMSLVRYSPEGQLMWSVAYDGPTGGNDYGAAMTVDADGNIYVAGYGYSSGIPNTRHHYMKCAPDGTLLWANSFSHGGAYSNISNDVAVDASGNMYVLGWTTVLGGFTDISLLKIDSSGSVEWSRKYNGPANYYDNSYALAVDSVGNVIATGRVGQQGVPDKVAILKYDPSGNLLWDELWDGPANMGGTATQLVLGADDSIYVGGHAVVGNTNPNGGSGKQPDQDVFIAKYSSGGVQDWVWTYNGPDNLDEHIQDLQWGPGGDLYFSGDTTTLTTDRDLLAGRVEPTGTTVWTASAFLDGSDPYLGDSGEALAIDSGLIHVVGSAERVVNPLGGGPETEEGTWIVTFDLDGEQLDDLFTVRDGYVREAAIAPDGCVYAVGVQWSNSADGLLIKYAEPFVDCNGNGTHDPDDIDAGVSEDCNGNGVPDECDLSDGTSNDCDDDAQLDECQIASDPALDVNGSGILDSCEAVGDLDGSGTTGVEDLLMLLGLWGDCIEGVSCPGDFDGDGTVGVLDLLVLLGFYGM